MVDAATSTTGDAARGGGLDPEVCAHWRLTPGPALGHRASGTWAATREKAAFVVKHVDPRIFPDWPYTLRVAAALRAQGWPTPEPAEEPWIRPDGAWVLFHRLPGRSMTPADGDRSAEARARGRLLAEFHASAAATGIVDQRGGFADPAELVRDPLLDHWLRVHERYRPDEGRPLRACRDATAAWFADNPVVDAPRSVIHGDFTPWNLLFDGGRLSGVVDFEATHHTYQVADFALSWRGYQDDVLRGYDEVRRLSDVEWRLVRPAFWAWMFIGLTDLLAARYGDARRDAAPPTLEWQVRHLRLHSPLLATKAGVPTRNG
ncbi:phosphotransferase enzyme family protein [Micromonospora globbae]|uniref:phosphotransferase enzyme family protein n=1 Tax=Micromonospora globbae TaxID=1894969 RepID=UPI00131511DA|nr:phosphotransferase [Micromonospora globbae]